jgi:4'-phosphopantetheinyl transferase
MSACPDLEPGDVHLLWCAPSEPRPGVRSVWLDAHLRAQLAAYAGLPAKALRFGREPRGRPFLLESRLPDLQFNLSDTVGGCLLAVARGLRIGLDLERADRSMPALRLARRYFAACEADSLACLPDDQQARAFVYAWTAKEAACKATGSGLRDRLDAWVFGISAEDRAPQPLAAPEDAGSLAHWQFLRVAPAPGFTAVLAAPMPIRRCSLRTLDRDA